MIKIKEKNNRCFIPKYVKKKTKILQCTFPGCKNTFRAYPHARFCKYHKNPATRPVKKKEQEETMFNLGYEFKEKVTIERLCSCCGEPYRIDVYPGRLEYSKFCDKHTSEFKRELWRKNHGKK